MASQKRVNCVTADAIFLWIFVYFLRFGAGGISQAE